MQAGANTNALNLTQTMLNMNARPPCKQITKHMVNPGDQWFPTPKPVCNIDTCTHIWTCWHYSSHTCVRAFLVRVRHSMSLHPLILVTHMPTFQTNFVKTSKPRSRNRTLWNRTKSRRNRTKNTKTVQNNIENEADFLEISKKISTKMFTKNRQHMRDWQMDDTWPLSWPTCVQTMVSTDFSYANTNAKAT